MKRLVFALLLLLPSLARAQDLKDRFNIKLIAQGMYLTEQSNIPGGFGREAQASAPFQLGYGELRGVIDGRRLPGNFDLHIDARARLSGEFTTDSATVGANQIVARGYLGGREYEVRQAWVRRRGDKVDFGLGRMVVAEADALKIDGARLWYRMSKHWDASLYGGAYPDPFSRSLTSDYSAGFAFAGGADATYTYDKIWGAFSVSGSYFGGNNDGGPVDATKAGTAGVVGTETPRTWITWTDYVRLISWLDLFTDVVVDATGAAGAQLTRLDAVATARAGKSVVFRVGYDHLSAFAIEMWLTRLLANRLNHLANTIENNLIVDRTARDEVRGQIDVNLGKLSLFGDGRFRRRALVSLTDDPQFVAAGSTVAPGIAYDATVGLRDRGTVWGLRPGVWGTYLGDYRSRSVILGVELGKSFYDERLTIDLAFLYASTTDALVNNFTTGPCTGVPPTLTFVQNNCYGTRGGSEYEVGLTVSGQPSTHWFMFLDYRLVTDLSSGNLVPATMTTAAVEQPTILTHMLLLRLEARY